MYLTQNEANNLEVGTKISVKWAGDTYTHGYYIKGKLNGFSFVNIGPERGLLNNVGNNDNQDKVSIKPYQG